MTFDNRFPILDFDTEKQALINPWHVFKSIEGVKHGVLCFFGEVIERLRAREDVRLLAEDSWEDGMHRGGSG